MLTTNKFEALIPEIGMIIIVYEYSERNSVINVKIDPVIYSTYGALYEEVIDDITYPQLLALARAHHPKVMAAQTNR